MIFDGPPHAVVLSPSDHKDEIGAAMLAMYRYICATAGHPVSGPPEPAEFLGVRVDRQDFKELSDDSDDGWRFDEAAWRGEVDRQCAAEFARMIYRWRRAFFAALLSG